MKRFLPIFAIGCMVLLASSQATAEPPDAGMSLIRGVLLTGQFRTQRELNAMSWEEQRNTLITELAGRTRNDVRFYQGLTDADLAGTGALLVYLRETASRTDAQIKTMSADDMRNTVIVEVGAQTGRGSDLQALSNMQLIQLVMGPERSFIRGVLLVGKFRTQRELNAMPGEDQRNTLITELVGRTRNTLAFYQGLNNKDLAGTGALLVYLRGTRSRTDAQLKTMTADDMRNTVIVEMHDQVHRTDLQTLTNMQLALTAFGSHELRSPDSLPEPQRPGQHTMVLRADRVFTWVTTRSFSDVPFFGIFMGRNLDCSHGRPAQLLSQGSGASLVAIAGWGQVEGDGHPGASTDPCMSWINQLTINFDTKPFDNSRHVPGLGQPDTGVGYMLIGDPLTVRNLTAEDNTRCTSVLSDLRLEVTYTVPPIQAEYDVDVVR